jgi:hypothetical protein
MVEQGSWDKASHITGFFLESQVKFDTSISANGILDLIQNINIYTLLDNNLTLGFTDNTGRTKCLIFEKTEDRNINLHIFNSENPALNQKLGNLTEVSFHVNHNYSFVLINWGEDNIGSCILTSDGKIKLSSPNLHQ